MSLVGLNAMEVLKQRVALMPKSPWSDSGPIMRFTVYKVLALSPQAVLIGSYRE